MRSIWGCPSKLVGRFIWRSTYTDSADYSEVVRFLSAILLVSPILAHATDCTTQARIYKQGKEYFSRSQFLLGATQFSVASAFDCDQSLALRSSFGLARSLQELNETGEALRVLDEAILNGQNGRLDGKPRLFRAFILEKVPRDLDVRSQSKMEIWLSRRSPSLSPQLFLDASNSEEDARQLGLAHRSLLATPRKIPGFSGAASAILPGAGQFYNGAYQSSAVAFLLNSLFLLSTIELAQKHMVAPAAASGLVFSVTYFGNIFNAVDGAKRVNAVSEKPREVKLKELLFPEFNLD